MCRYGTYQLVQKMNGGDRMVAFTRILHRTRPDRLMDEASLGSAAGGQSLQCKLQLPAFAGLGHHLTELHADVLAAKDRGTLCALSGCRLCWPALVPQRPVLLGSWCLVMHGQTVTCSAASSVSSLEPGLPRHRGHAGAKLAGSAADASVRHVVRVPCVGPAQCGGAVAAGC